MKRRDNIHTISLRKRLSAQTKPGMHSSPPCGVDVSIIAVGNVKGGVGKTTLAVNLTICEALSGHDVLLIDGDEQGTARAFTQLRAEQLGAPGIQPSLSTVPRSALKFASSAVSISASSSMWADVTRRACVRH